MNVDIACHYKLIAKGSFGLGVVVCIVIAGGCQGSRNEGFEYNYAVRNSVTTQNAPAKANIAPADLIARGRTEDTKKTGEWFYFYSDDRPLARGNYDRGTKEGYWEYWHKSGHLWMAGRYGVFVENGKIYSRPEGLWIVLTDEGTLDLLPEGALKCDGVNLYSETYWSSRVDWQSLSSAGIDLFYHILPHWASFRGPGDYTGGVRTRLLTIDGFADAAREAR